MKSLFACLIVLMTNTLYGQETGQVQFQVDVDNGYFEIVIDDTMYLKIYKTQLPPGKHTAKIWSPGYITQEVDFEIVANQTTTKYVEMAESNSRQEFEREYKAYRMKFHKSLTLPGTSTLAMALTSGGFMMAAYYNRNRVLDNIDLYHKAPTYAEVIQYKTEINNLNKKYNRQRIGFYTSLSLTAVGLATTIFTYTRFKNNNTEPVLNDPSPFKDKFSLNVSPLGCQIIWRLG